MAQSQQKTEKPTERRKREARRRGDNAKSQEIGVAITMLTVLATLRLVAPNVVDVVAGRTRAIFAGLSPQGFDAQLGSHALTMAAAALLPVLGLTVALGIAGGVLQVGFTLAPEAIKPKMSNLSLKRGLNRFKPSIMGWEFLRTGLKLGLLIALVWSPISVWIEHLGRPLGLADAVALAGDQVWTLVLRTTGLAVLIAGADYAMNKWRNSKQLKLTKQELKEEMKSSEGDPLVKGARRRRALELTRNRMIADVATADVVITNPTHLAVALAYDPSDPAPRVVAKGSNRIAAKIRREAYRNGVTVLENKPLARTLFRTVKIGQFVPGDLFEAVATILAVAYRRRARFVGSRA